MPYAPTLPALLLAAIGALPAPAAPSYNADIRPVLSNACFQCHGPDEAERKGDTRLDVPGEADLDEVLARITSTDPDEVMPPPSANKDLSPEQIEAVRAWVAGGAEYEQHWAFVPPAKPTVPEGANPIDHFIGRKLAEAGVDPAPRADPYTLVRRLHLDLVGLPPAPEVADAFAADPSDTAYQALVDQLLADPAYGERWARRWLDLARYADTNGYEKDRDRSIWPYRDWVIRALNADMPFDQFTVEQLAGDMLPDAARDQLVATGFHRNTMLNEEGGIDPLEFRYHASVDRINTTGTAWLGLTLGCAQCHTHKYDPVTHTDYFGMMAYLNNADEPDLLLPDPGAEERHRANLTEADRLLAELESHWPADKGSPDAAFEAWLAAAREGAVAWQPLEPTELSANVPYLTHEGGGVVFVAGDTSKHDVLTLTFPPRDEPTAALQLEALPDDRLPDRGPGTTFYEGRKGDFFLTEFKVGGATVEGATESYAKNRFGNHPVSAALATDGDIQTGWSVAEGIGARHVAVFPFAEAVPAGTPITVEMHFGRHYASTLGKFRLSATTAPGAKASPRAADVADALAASTPDAAQFALLRRTFLLEAPELAEQAKRIRELQSPPAAPHTLVLRERPASHPRPTHRHHRGEYTQPEERVTPRLPDAIFPAGSEPPADRLEFARWLVAPENPLTPRVVANRHWAAFFGTGIVPTLDDFGMQGRLPSHPQLLDHLAVYLVESGWSIKALHRHIVSSETYRRASSAGASKAPPALLATFPRQRLEAEIIRDSALAAAGVLNAERFGPPVRPPQPGGVTESAYGKPKWNPSPAPDRYRRSIYTFIKRTAPFAMFTTFDAGSGEACIARRDRSNTPLQALTLMNDPMFVEIAERYGETVAKTEGDDAAKVTAAFRRLLTRPPTEAELAALLAFHEKHRSDAALARALLSLDEAVTKE